MNDWLVYASAGFAGLLWGAGYVQPAVAFAFVAGLWLGTGSDVMKWAVLALIAGYIVGNLIIKKRQVTKIGV
jgi:membrane protein DedA with SNARE-associated domain